MAPSIRVPSFRPPRRRRIHEDVAEQLRDAILDGRFRAGRKLPPERDLAEEFRVNRTSVREAIKVLEGLGLVTVRQGDGATVRPLVDASLEVLAPMIFHAGRLDTRVMGEVTEVIVPLLCEMARLAIERCRPGQIETLQQLRDRMADERRDREERFAAGREVLVVLSDMTENRVWQMLARRARSLLASPPMAEARRRLRRDPGRLVPLIDTCLAAIDGGRPADAMAALACFIESFRESTLDVQLDRRRPRAGAAS